MKNHSMLSKLRQQRRPIASMLAALIALWQVGQPILAADVNWNAGSGSNFNWFEGANWSAGIPGLADNAILPFTIPNPGVLANPGVIVLDSSSTANLVSFSNNYTLTGGTLTLGAGGLRADMGTGSIINSVVAGSAGLTKTGGGFIRLSNANTYTGVTTINNGSLIITHQNALGVDSSPVVVTSISPSGNGIVTGIGLRGFGGGSLVLDGTGGSIVFSRDLSLQGLGPISDRGAALISLGENTLSGTVTMGTPYNGTNIATRIIAANGTLNFTGTLNVLGTAATTLNNLGGILQAGASFYNVTGVLAGTGTLEASGGGTLFLNPSNSSGFSGSIRVSGSAASGQSVVRIDSPNVLGMRTGSASAGSVLDLNAGILAILMDTPSVLSGGIPANVYSRSIITSHILVDHTVGNSAINQTATFGQLGFAAGAFTTINSRNGYNVAFSSAPVVTGDGSPTITNSLQGGGILTFSGNVWSNANGSSRTMTFNGNGDTLLTSTANFNAAASSAGQDHNLTKFGLGILTIQSTASTLDGNLNIQQGAVRLADFRSLNMHPTGTNTGGINLANSSNSAVLEINGNNVAQANLTTTKLITMSGSTGGGAILANQTGTSPGLLLNGNIGGTGSSTSAKTLILGGSNAANNTINGIISNTGAGAIISLHKTDPGTWNLAGVNNYGGSTTISNGLLRATANASTTSSIIPDASAIIFNLNTLTASQTTSHGFQSAGGTFEFFSNLASATTESVGALTPAAGLGVVKVSAGGAGAATLRFGSLGTRSAGASINFQPGSNAGIQFVTPPAGINGIIGGFAYITTPSGAIDFAATPSANANIAAFGAASALPGSGAVGTANYSLSSPLTTTAAQAINSLRITSGANLTLGGALSVTANSATSLGGILHDNAGGSSIISGAEIRTSTANQETVVTTGGISAANTLTINSVITGTNGASGSGQFTKTGNGVLILGGSNTYTGNTHINEGTVRLSGATATLGNPGNTNSLNVRQKTTLDLNAAGAGGAVTVGALNGNGTITNSGGGTASSSTLVIGPVTGTATGTFSGVLQDGAGVLHVTKNGSGLQTVWGNNTYTGATTINGSGILAVEMLAGGGQPSSIGASASAAPYLVFGGASVAANTGLFGGLSYFGSQSIETDRLFTFAGTAPNSGARVLSNGLYSLSTATQNNAALIFTNTAPLAFATPNVEQGLSLGGNSTGDNRFGPQITDNGTGRVSLFKLDVGLWHLDNAANSYTGVTSVFGGMLGSSSGSTLPGNSPLLLSGGKLYSSGTFTRNATAVLTPGNANEVLISFGVSGFAAGASKLVVALGGVGSEQALTWGSPEFTPTQFTLNSAVSFADVEVRNPINLNGATRTVNVLDNTLIGADFATLSGVISGGAGSNFIKSGAGILFVGGANTYEGATQISQGTLVVSSLGSSSGGASSSLGASGIAMDNNNALLLGNGSTAGGILQHAGPGETSDRKIRLNSTTASNQIHADSVGPLILTNVANDLAAGAKTLFLRGVNAGGNMITSRLSDNGGSLTIIIDGSATWILTNEDNDFTGLIAASGGALGIGHDSALGVGTFELSGGPVFAFGGGRTISNTTRANGGVSHAVMGEHSITLLQSLQHLMTNTSRNLVNSIATGEALNLNAGVTFNTLTTGTLSWTIDGPGTTNINGDITTSTAFGVGLVKSGDGILNLGGTGAGNFNQAGAVVDVDRGTLRLGVANAIPSGPGRGNVTLTPEAFWGDTAILDLNGFNLTVNGLTATSDGIAIIDNSGAASVTLTIGANDQAVTVGGLGSYTITDTGAGSLSLLKTGAGSATVGAGVNLTYQGSTGVSGGSMIIASPLNGSTGLSVTNTGSILALTGGMSAPGAISSLVVGGGSTLSLLDGSGNKLSNLASMQLGSIGGAMTTLSLNVGDFTIAGDEVNTDTLTLVSGGTLSLFGGNKIRFNLTDIGLNANQTYQLLGAVGGGLTTGPLGAGDWVLGATPGGFTSFVLNVSDTNVSVTTGNLILGTSYWRGMSDTTWNGAANNWSQDKAGSTPALGSPGQGTDVVFQWNAPSSASVTTTLEQNFKINSLVFEDAAVVANTPASVTINPGAAATNRLEIAPQTAADGIKLATTNATMATISGPVRLGADQTWQVSNANSVLTLGSLQGAADVTKTGLGKVVLINPADNTFNSGETSDLSIAGGTVEITSATALGSAANSNLARVSIGAAAAFYHNNATSGTVANQLILAGGTLSAGGANQTYSGPVTMNADSFINLRDMNSAIGTVARNITFSGVITGAGGITLDASTSVSLGNQLSGTLTLSNNNSGWTGGIHITRGTILASDINALGAGHITASAGRIQFITSQGQTFNINQNITVDAPDGVLELNVDTITANPTNDLQVNFGGVITLGSATNANIALRLNQSVDNFSVMRITNSIILGNDASISVAGSATRPLLISGVISETGGARALSINDDLGGWSQTNRTLRLAGLNAFSGDITLASGILEFETVSNAGGPASSLGQGTAINITGGSTLSFIGSSSQTTNRPIMLTTSASLVANGTAGASITYAGQINASGNTLTLAGLPGSPGILSGGLIQSGTIADININSGHWTFTGSPMFVADDLVMSGGSLLTLAAANVYDSGSAIADAAIFVRGDSTLRLAADDAIVGGSGNTNIRRVSLADSTTAGTGTLDLNGHGFSIRRVDLGAIATGFTGVIQGTGSISLLPNLTDWNDGMRLYRGSISHGTTISGTGSLLKQGLDAVTMANTGSSWTGNAASRIDAGELILDFTLNNDAKIPSNVPLDMRGGRLSINGNASDPSVQNVAGYTLAGGGQNSIAINPGSGQIATLNLGAITRNAAHGILRYVMQPGSFLKTTTANGTHGLLGSSAFVTIQDGSGTWFARNDGGGNIVPMVSVVKDDIGTWVAGDHVTSSTGYTGSLPSGSSLGSLRFNSPAGTGLSIPNWGGLGIESGGILITGEVIAGAPAILGGTLSTASNDVIIRHDGTPLFTISSDIRLLNAVTKGGAGSVMLSGNNNFTGAVSILAGTLLVAGGNAIGDSAPVSLSASHASTLELLASETIGRLSGGSATTGLNTLATVNIGAHTLTINNTGGNTIYGGYFIGTGSIIKNGFGTNTNLNVQNISSDFTGQVIVNEGLFQISNIGQIDASGFVVNRHGVLLIDNNGGTRSGTRILDTTPITLHSASGSVSGETRPRGLALRTDQDSTTNTSETIGVLTFDSGANYGVVDNSGGISSRPTLTAANFIRQNSATINIRGRNLGDIGSVARSQFRITAAGTAEIDFNAAHLYGGGGTAGGFATNVSIIPWAIGERYTGGNLGDANMGNTLVTYVPGSGITPLNLANEYASYAVSGAQDNTREVLDANLVGLAGKTVNSLVLHNNNNGTSGTFNVTGAGPGHVLGVSSGAFLFTLNSGAVLLSSNGIALSGFNSGITVGAANEYVFHVVNPSSSAFTPTLTATISSPLISSADITKSGRGTLVLTSLNTAGGGARKTTLNEGTLEIADLDNIGGSTGGLVFAGGTLRLGTGFADDISNRAITYMQGGGVLDTNGNNVTLNGSVGSGVGGFTKAGLGTLTLNAASTYSGTTVVSEGELTIGANNATGVGGDLIIQGGAILNLGTSSLSHGQVTLATGSPAIVGTGTLQASRGFVVNSTSSLHQINAVLAGAGGLIKSQNASLTLTGANTYSGITEIQAGELVFSTIGNVGGGASNLGAPITVQNGVIRTGLGASPVVLTYDGAGNSTNRIIEIQGTTGGLTINANGTGALNLGRIQTSTYGDKTLVLQGTSIGLNNSVEQILEVGSKLSVVKDGPGIWSFTGANANSYTGSTTVNQGTLRLTKTIPNAAIVGDSSAGNVDVVIMGGSLILAASEQLHNTVGLVLHAGSFSFSGSGLIETVSSFANTGGTFATGANTLIGQGATVTWAGGVNTISTGGQVIDKHWVIGGGVNTVEQGGELVVQSGGGPAGMFFTGTDSPTVTLDSSAGTAGRLLLKQDLVVDAGLTSGTAQILNGGAANNAGAVDLDGAVRAFSVHNGAAVVDLRISAQIHNGGIDKTGAGTLELRGPSAYELGTTVSAGTLLVNNLTGSGTGSGNVLVQPGAVLAGSGAIASTHGLASVRVQGMLDVGNVTDTEGQDFVVHLTGGASTINLDGTVRLDLWSGFSSGSLNPSPAADMLDATALSISIGSGSILTVEGANNVPGLWAYNSAWKLFNWGVVPSGEFGAINLPDLSGWDPMAAWDTSNLYTAGANGGTIMIVLAPEPGRALLMLLGLLGLGLRRRRSL